MNKKNWMALLTVGGMALVTLCVDFAGLFAGKGVGGNETRCPARPSGVGAIEK